MILIISKECLESSTEKVMDWLDFFGADYIRINGDDIEANGKIYFNLINSEPILRYKNTEIPLNKIKTVWFRRWSDSSYKNSFFKIENEQKITHSLLTHQASNIIALKNFLFSLLESKRWLTHPRNITLNKLEVLLKAKEVGLNIPATIVCSLKNDLIYFNDKYREIISKDLSHPLIIEDSNTYSNTLTRKIDFDEIEELPNEFSPTLFQELIHKQYEIRTFFIDGECYSMAIFSQNDSKTEIDFRNYNKEKPNRNIPFILPKDITRKIKDLFKLLNLDTGSVDLIVDISGKYIFLEINSVGQFGMTSFPCNYYLEKIIARYLINEKNE